MTRTLYVGNLPWSTSSEELADAFRAHGEVISSNYYIKTPAGPVASVLLKWLMRTQIK